jgi:hypothetical protein
MPSSPLLHDSPPIARTAAFTVSVASAAIYVPASMPTVPAVPVAIAISVAIPFAHLCLISFLQLFLKSFAAFVLEIVTISLTGSVLIVINPVVA